VRSHELRVAYFASTQQYHSLYIDVLMQMHQSQPANGFEVAAFQASERARARTLLDLLVEAQTDIYHSIEPALSEKEHTLRQRLNAKSERQMRLLGGGKYSEQEAAELEKEIGDLTFELENVRAQFRERSPRHWALTEPQPLSLKNVQELLDEKTLLLEYSLGEKRSYLWTIDTAGINTYLLPGRAQIEKLARSLYDLLSARQMKPGESLAQYELRAKESNEQYWPLAHKLGKMILGPVAERLGTKRLLIVADGALLMVPFSALTVSTSSSEPVPLMLEHDIVNLPSAATLAVLRNMTAQRQTAQNAVAVLADPVYERDDPRLEVNTNGAPTMTDADVVQATKDLSLNDTGSGIPRLMASAEEAEDIVHLVPRGAGVKLLGFAANLDTVRNPAMAQYRILHFAAHGIFNNEHPELSGIILSLYDKQAEPTAGFLRLQEVYNLNLPVDLVVLSACDTARGKEVEGEGLIGLTRGFMYAGAAGVVASLWKVDEDATAELMKYFYAGVFKERLAPAAALRAAQIKMWQSKRRRSPYYWAAFVLQGEYQQALVVDGPEPPYVRIAIALFIFLALFGGMYVVRRNRVTAGKQL
jgi:CHAT domain-containing protein